MAVNVKVQHQIALIEETLQYLELSIKLFEPLVLNFLKEISLILKFCGLWEHLMPRISKNMVWELSFILVLVKTLDVKTLQNE